MALDIIYMGTPDFGSPNILKLFMSQTIILFMFILNSKKKTVVKKIYPIHNLPTKII